MNRDTRGTALLAALFILAFLGISLALLHRRIFRLAQLRHEEQAGFEYDQEAWAAVSELLVNAGPIPGCSAATQQEPKVCIWHNRFDPDAGHPAIVTPSTGYAPEKLPLWRSPSLKNNPLRCLGLVPLPKEITPSAVASRRSCDSLTGEAAVDGNVVVTSATELNQPALSSSGAIAIEALSIQSPATIFAAGDIIIGSLTAPFPVLLVSATGDVVVKSTTAVGTVSAISPRAVYLPPGAAAPQFEGALPPQLPFIVLGRSTD